MPHSPSAAAERESAAFFQPVFNSAKIVGGVPPFGLNSGIVLPPTAHVRGPARTSPFGLIANQIGRGPTRNYRTTISATGFVPL